MNGRSMRRVIMMTALAMKLMIKIVVCRSYQYMYS